MSTEQPTASIPRIGTELDSIVGHGYHISGTYASSDNATANPLFTLEDRDVVLDNSNTDRWEDILYEETRTKMSESFSASAKIGVKGAFFGGEMEASFRASYDESRTYSYGLKFVYIQTGTSRLAFGPAEAKTHLSDEARSDIDGSLPFDELFNKWGTHYVLEETRGGRFYMAESVSKSSSQTEMEVKAGIKADYKAVSVEGNISFSKASSHFRESRSVHMRQKGGLATIDASTRMKDWEASVQNNPAVIDFAPPGTSRGPGEPTSLAPIWTLCSNGTRRRDLESHFNTVYTGRLEGTCVIKGFMVASIALSAGDRGFHLGPHRHGSSGLWLTACRKSDLSKTYENHFYTGAPNADNGLPAQHELNDALKTINSDNFVILTTLFNAFSHAKPPVPELITTLEDMGGTKERIDTARTTRKCGYILVGSPGLGKGNGFEFVSASGKDADMELWLPYSGRAGEYKLEIHTESSVNP